MDINLLEPLYVNCTTDPPMIIGADGSAGARWFQEIVQCIQLLNNPTTRSLAIMELKNVYLDNKEIGPELGLLIWNSPGAPYALLLELFEGHRLLSPPRIGFIESTKICNALILIQCIASHPEAKMGLIKAEIPQYFYPFLKTSEKELLQFDNLRLAGLIVIKELVEDDPTSEIVHYLLKSEAVPLCLRCMDVGDETAKTVAAFVIGKILKPEEGKVYIGSFTDRFVVVSKALSKVVDEFTAKPPTLLVRNILICYTRLSEISNCREVLRACYPTKLKDLAYLDEICDEGTKSLALRLLDQQMRIENLFVL